MKLIDEKGRLFGKVNLIDLLVVLVVLALVAVVAFRLAGGSVDDVQRGNTMTLEYEVLCPTVPVDAAMAAEADSVGQTLMNNGELVAGTITGCVVEDSIITVADGMGNAIEVVDATKRDVRFTILAEISTGDITNQVGTQEVRVGKSHIVKTTEFEITGTVTWLELGQ